MRLILLILVVFSWLSANAVTYFEYFGADNNEAEFSLPLQLTLNQAATPTKVAIDLMVREQMRFMFGLMRSRSNVAAALYPKWSYTVSEIRKAAKPGSWSVNYILKAKGLFSTGTRSYTSTRPYSPKTLFAESKGKCMVGE